MKAVQLLGFLVLAISLDPRDGGSAQASKSESLDGDWQIVGMVYRGDVQSDGPFGTVQIAGGKLWIIDIGVDAAPEIKITLRTSVIPKEIDLETTWSRGVWPGIYDLKDGTLRIIFARPGHERPKEFAALKHEDRTLYVLKAPAKR